MILNNKKAPAPVCGAWYFLVNLGGVSAQKNLFGQGTPNLLIRSQTLKHEV